MFFYLSKLIWIVLQPTAALILLLWLGLLALSLRRRRLGLGLVAVAALGLAVSGFAPIGAVLILPLEERFGRADPEGAVAGIVVLGGAVDPEVGERRGTVALQESGERMTEAVALARRFPQARIVFTGGSAAVFPDGTTEAQAAARFFEEMGVPAERLVFEDRSRNTAENAAFTRAMVDPEPGSTWLLVTSAYHMPRAMGCFRAAGFPVGPWPVDYRTGGREDRWRLQYAPAYRLQMVDTAVREWVGLAAYRLTGRTDALLPAPVQAAGGPSR